jgi:hypothetical protein
MLDEVLQEMTTSGRIPLVWEKRLPYVAQKRLKGSVENEEEDDDLEFDDEDPASDIDDEDHDFEFDDEDDEDFDDEDDLGLDGDDDLEDFEVGDDDFSELDDEQDDPDRQGLIRVVPNAHLVYKRAAEDGTFEELWIYNTGDSFEPELETRRAILAGTDIPMNSMTSQDGNQAYVLWTAGNAQMLHITGLPS